MSAKTHPVIVGWRVRRVRVSKKGKPILLDGQPVFEWANGADAWSSDQVRGFVFTTTMGADHDEKRSNRGGRAWARSHLAHLARAYVNLNKGWRLHVTIVRRKASA